MYSRMLEDNAFCFDTDDGAGGSSDAGDEEVSEEADEVDEEAEAAEAAAGTGPKPGSKRWNKIYARSKLADQYQGYGSPAEIAQKLARLEILDQAIDEKEEEGESDDKETSDLKEKRALIRKQLREVEPELQHLGELTGYAADHAESLRTRAAEACVDAMKENGFEVSDESYKFFANSLNNIIKSDRRLYLIYLTSPERAVAKAYETYAKPFQAESDRKKGAALAREGTALKRLPKHVKSGSSSAPVKRQKEAADNKEAEAQFIKQFEDLQEE